MLHQVKDNIGMKIADLNLICSLKLNFLIIFMELTRMRLCWN